MRLLCAVAHAVVLAAAFFLTGCPPVHYRMPSAAGLQPEQIAVANARRAIFGAESVLWTVDGERAGRFTPMSAADLTPGPHLLNVGYKEGGLFTQSYSRGTVAVCLVAEPGHRYEIRTGAIPAEHFYQIDSYWRPWIIDEQSGQVVSSFPARGAEEFSVLPATAEVLSLHSCWGRGTLDPQAAPRAAVAALSREMGGDGDAVVCQGNRMALPTADAPPREWAKRFAAVREKIQPCLEYAERDGVPAYDHAIARRIVRRIAGARYVTKEESKDQSDAASIGVDLFRDGTEPVVLEALAGGPAARAGVLTGDRIVQVGEVATRGLPLGDIADLLRGPSGTSVTLTIVRGGETRSIAVTRAVVKLPMPATEWLEEGIGYVRLRTLEQGSIEPFAKAVEPMQKARGVVVDLRANSS